MDKPRGPPNVENMVTLKVDNITYGTTSETLREMFERYGEIGDVYIPRDHRTQSPRGFAFVRFLKQEDADNAISGLDGRTFEGRELRIQLAQRQRPADPKQFYASQTRRPRRSRSRSYERRGRDRSRSRGRYGDRSRSRSRGRDSRRDYDAGYGDSRRGGYDSYRRSPDRGGRGGYDDRRGDNGDRRDNYDDRRGGYDDRRRDYDDRPRRDSFDDRRGGYDDRRR